MPRSPRLESRVTRAVRAENKPKVDGPSPLAVIMEKIIPTTAMVPKPEKLIRVSRLVWEKNSFFILSTRLF